MRAGTILLAALLACAAHPGRAEESTPGATASGAGMVGDSVADKGSEAGFRTWVAEFRPRALAAGISAATFDATLSGAQFDPAIVEKDRNQNEFTKTIWVYLDSAASEERIANGRTALAENAALLDRIEAEYGVDRSVVVAIWGLESAYGTFRGRIPTIDALATLAYDGRRRSFFEAELLQALRILQDGHVTPDRMVGSWAGAMGHTQFMPSSWAAFAVDFNGDGRRDIWSDDAGDALASTAAFLRHWGWVTDQPWGYEVRLPAGFDYTLSGEKVVKPVADWQALGVRTATGGDLTQAAPASVLLPAGARGAAFLVFPNFHVIEHYNPADAYVIAVGHLADRIRGSGPILAAWPREDRALTLDERVELQARLASAGFDPGGVDGKIGPNTIAAVRAFQTSRGLIPDGYASLDILTKLR